MAIFYDVEPNSPEHQMLRLGVVTASAFSDVMTPKKRQVSTQAVGYMCRKLAEKITGEPNEIESMMPRPWMERGQELEDEAVRCYESLREVETTRGGFWTNDAGTVGCSPDRGVAFDGLLEIKCPLFPKQIETAITGDFGDHTSQLQGQLFVTGRNWVDIFSYHPRLILDPKRIYRDEDFIADLDRVLGVFIREMQRHYESLIEQYGPFPIPASAIPPVEEIADGLGVSDADVDELFAARRREQEQQP